ncbi:PASTA domain-containing protein [Baekduia sp.]|uniref:PASTA domain-containing protein n=1 Tax=Baekduia sp. TaxID=2600305 RepID=UPI002D1FB497|nr:PASTA domain-containing protein [Baekduia sp.]
MFAAAASTATGHDDTTPVASAAKVKRVPNEVGRNHQAAQDDLQAHGFYNLREQDCSGRGRMLLFDRNWKVVRQSPRAGSRVSTSRTITLCSVKYSD